MSTVGIPLAFVAAAAVLLWILIWTPGRWVLKAVAIVVLMALSLALWSSFSEIAGWPAEDELPETFVLLGAVYREPPKGAADGEGAIFVWLQPIDVQNTKRADDPRCIKRPYSRELHKQLEEGMGQVRRGRRVVGKRHGNKGKRGGGGPEQEPDVNFYELPPAAPSKEEE